MIRMSRFLAPLAFAVSVALSGVAAADVEWNDELQLNTSITATGEDIRLGDIFTGYLSRPEKVVAKAPRPGQRTILSAEWLSNLARTYGLNWRPANGYDRVIVYQPGQSIAAQDILTAVKNELIARGMPANLGIKPGMYVPAVTVAADVIADIGVREAFYDVQTKTFSAVVEVPPGTPNAQFVSLRGTAFPVVTVPALKESVAKNVVITAAMITMTDLPEDQMRADTITDAAALVGKAPKIFLRAGQPVREAEVGHMTLVEVPVLTADVGRDGSISNNHVVFAAFNAADLPGDVITEPSQLVGRTPRRYLPAGTPLRRGDVQLVNQVRVPVAARDLSRGEQIGDAEITWVTMNDNEVVANAVTDETALMGRVTRHPVRAGQALRSYDITRPTAVVRGKAVTIVWATASMNLTVQGQALQTGGIGDSIRVANTKSKTSVVAEIVDEHTVRVVNQQTAAR